MTRYDYTDVSVPTYRVTVRKKEVGECWRRGDILGRRRYDGWYARIFTDPKILGQGRTRDEAVGDCYRQIGGADA